jgi:Domain of unknown function (DUF4406)
MSTQKRIYISGKISGLDHEVAKMYFKGIEEQLAAAGHIPINPMELVPYSPDLTWEDYMKDDIYALLHCSDILMLDNWQESRGARIEHAVAKEAGIAIHYSKTHELF